MKRILPLFVVFILLSSHELFLKTDTYFLKTNSTAELYLFNGTFDQSENIITRDRILQPQIIGPGYEFKPRAKDFYDRKETTYLKFKTGQEGTYVAGISTKPRVITLSGEDFSAYLEHEGLTEVIADRDQKGISQTSAREEYAKHVKTLLQVGRQRTTHFSTEFGYPIEFVPLQNPYTLAIGDEMSFKLLFQGEPLKDKTVHVSSRGSLDVKEGDEVSLKTNEEGVVRFPLDSKGHWYIATIHMLESEKDTLDYESHWATLTFEVK